MRFFALDDVKTGRSGINFKKLGDRKTDAVPALVKQVVRTRGLKAVA